MHQIESIVQSEPFLQQYRKTPFIAPLTVSKVGYFPSIQNHHISRPKGLNEYILIYCIDGQGKVGSKTPNQLVHKGDVILIKPHTSHTYMSCNDTPWSILWTHFYGNEVDSLVDHFISSDNLFISSISYQPHIVDLFHQLIHIYSSNSDSLNMLRATSCLQHLLCEIIASEKISYTQQSHFNDMKESIAFMKSHLSEKISLEQLATQANLSKYHFSRKFKSYTGYAPLEYFNRLKINSASKLLQTTDFPITAISHQLGFSTPYYFSECFKKMTGYSPSQYKTLIHTYF